MTSLAFLIVAYLLGSLPLVYWLLRLKDGKQHQKGDLHESLWSLSRKLGAVGFLFDMAKGPIVIFVGRGLGFSPEVVALAGVVAVVGQMWPLYLLRSGGGGNSIGMTMALALAVYPALIALIPILVGLGWRITTHVRAGLPPLGPPPSRSLPLSMAISFATLPVASWMLNKPTSVTLAFAGTFAAIMIKRVTKCLSSEARSEPITVRWLLSHLIFD